tara:strand:- start:168 stop:1043 length:876 start_codon:yes stop_codon:yes gene_type:complete
MKFSGSGSIAFKLLGQHYKNTLKKELKKQRNDVTTLAQKLINDYYTPTNKKKIQEIKQILEKPKFSKWEKQVVKTFENNGIKNETKFREFPLHISETVSITYIPDFLLKDFEKDEKLIIVEAHPELTPEAIAKNSAFMKQYFDVYHLIMIVPDSDLRIWNEADQNSKLFHDIWVIDNLEDLIEHLKINYRKDMTETVCPTCKTKAIGKKQILSIFGERKKPSGEKYPQAYCKDCRSKERKVGSKKMKEEIEELEKEINIKYDRFCTGCHEMFQPKKLKDAFCEKCSKAFTD